MHNIDKIINYDEEVVEPIDDEAIQDEEPEQQIKRRVVGRMPRRPVIRQTRPEPIVMSPAIPSPAQFMMEMRQPTYYQQQVSRKSPEEIAKEQVRVDMIYQRELEKAQRRQDMMSRPRLSTSQKLLNVAHQYADSGGTQRVNQGLGVMFRKPNVSLPSPNARRGEATINSLNKTIKNIAPKISKKRKGFAF